MNAKRRLGIAVAVTAAVLACANTASAWWGFGHYRVAVDIREQMSGIGVNPAYAMVPDAFKAKNFTQVISVPFTWSHGVQRLAGEITPPAIPNYPNDGRFPGAIMYELTTQKMSFPTGAERLEAKETAIGAVVHNAADNVVHWDYFRGDGGLVYGQNMWVRNHCTKEEWASYIIMMLVDGGVETTVDPGADGILGTDDDLLDYITPEELAKVFNPVTGLVMWENIYGGKPKFSDLVADGGYLDFRFYDPIMHMGMKVHRKNRRESESNGSSSFTVKTVEQIRDAIHDEFPSVLDPDAPDGELVNMTEARWHVLDFKSRNKQFLVGTECGNPLRQNYWPNNNVSTTLQPWRTGDVLINFDLSVERGIKWLQNLDPDPAP